MPELVFVSDLHLGVAGHRELEPHGGAFASFIHHLGEGCAEDVGSRDRRLVLLGDVFELLLSRPPNGPPASDASLEAALERLGWIASLHDDVFAALGAAASSGLRIEIVPGNHDLDLHRPAVRRRLRELTARASGAAVATVAFGFHPWMFRVERLVHAEHGHHHHDINRVDPLMVVADGGELRLPIAGRIERRQATAGHTAAVVREAAVELASKLRKKRGAPVSSARGGLIGSRAVDAGLTTDTFAELARLCEVRLDRTARRLARVAVAGAPEAPGGSRYLYDAVLRTDRLLRSAGADVPFYVFGHTHTTARARLEGSSSEYLNTGTWLGQSAGGYPYVVARDAGGPPEAELRFWAV